MQLQKNHLHQFAYQILSNSATKIGFKASLNEADNYNRVWARDSAVTALAIFANQFKDLYPAIKSSIMNLQAASSYLGQIPSNVSLDDNQMIDSVSFGGPVGRTDASFWWIIMTIQYLHQFPNDDELKKICFHKSEEIFKLADAWEFNGKHLMYVPMSSNWADEYVTHGYVLYDQLLRLWALELAGYFFSQEKWIEKSINIKIAIKVHYLLEDNLTNSFFTEAQKNDLINFNLSENFIASFSPGDRLEKFDFWSIALLFLLKIPSAATAKKLETAVVNIFNKSGEKGIPAFYPIISESDLLYQDLLLNHHYRFKNYPGHFHNGGIWPVVNGFLIAGLKQAGYLQTANNLMCALVNNLTNSQTQHPFAEYYDFYKALPGGVDNLCYSASGLLFASKALEDSIDFTERLFFHQQKENNVLDDLKFKTVEIIKNLDLNKNKINAFSISGESGCGKTTLALALEKELIELGYKVIILHQDDYFKLPPKQNHQARVDNFENIGIQEVRLELLDNHVQIIKDQKITSLEVPQMDWVDDLEKNIDLNISDVNVVIIEGTYTSMLKNIEKRIFINTNYKLTKKNRLARNRETVNDFIEKVLAKESDIISKHQTLADLVLNHQFDIN